MTKQSGRIGGCESERTDVDRPLILEQVSDRVNESPHLPAIISADGTLSYMQLDQRANRIARRLRALGIGRGSLVAVYVPRSADYVIASLGIMKVGAGFVPLDPAYPRERLEFVLRDCGASSVVTRENMRASLPSVAPDLVLLDRGLDIAGRGLDGVAASELTPRDTAYVIYTSGSTGRPKGVQVEHGSVANLVSWHQRAFEVTSRDRGTLIASPAFDASVWEIWPYLTAGATLCIPSEEIRISPERLRDWLLAQDISISFLPTPLAERVLTLDWPPEATLRLVLTGGDVLRHYPPRGLPFVLVNNYGPTENTVVTTSGAVEAGDPSNHQPTIGRPIDNVQVYILDEVLNPVQPGDVGELYIAGSGLARGYLHRADLTTERFVPDPFGSDSQSKMYRSGDLARRRNDGNIEFLGRIDHQVKLRGHRIELEEIEISLGFHPDVQTCVVTVNEDGSGDERLTAYVVSSRQEGLTVPVLREYLAERLPDYMVPASFVCLDALPLTTNGKIDRAALAGSEASMCLIDVDEGPPGSAVEERVADILANLLGREHVSRHDNFFLLGGHSLMGAQVVSRVRDGFGVELSLLTLFEAPTVSDLSAEIERLIYATVEAMSDEEAERLLI
ncbi:MAG: non-ribosomal peptide synthetase [Chloroflexota bacterium]